MFRDGSTANAANVTLVATPGNGVSFQWRTTPGAASNYTNIGTIPAPTPSAPVLAATGAQRQRLHRFLQHQRHDIHRARIADDCAEQFAAGRIGCHIAQQRT
jgi:hypothetical protein